MLNINIIKDKSDLYFQNNLKQHLKGKDEKIQKDKFYHFVSSLCQKVITTENVDFSGTELDIIKQYNIDINDLLNYLKIDIKNFYVESGNINNSN